MSIYYVDGTYPEEKTHLQEEISKLRDNEIARKNVEQGKQLYERLIPSLEKMLKKK